MKTLGRILIILAAFSILSALMVIVVNASGSSSSGFDGAPSQFRPREGEGEFPQFDGAQTRPEGDQFRPERRDRDGAGGSRWMFGLTRSFAVIALLVTLIVLPKSISRKRKQVAANAVNGEA